MRRTTISLRGLLVIVALSGLVFLALLSNLRSEKFLVMGRLSIPHSGEILNDTKVTDADLSRRLGMQYSGGFYIRGPSIHDDEISVSAGRWSFLCQIPAERYQVNDAMKRIERHLRHMVEANQDLPLEYYEIRVFKSGENSLTPSSIWAPRRVNLSAKDGQPIDDEALSTDGVSESPADSR